MSEKKYAISLEVSGDFGMFADPMSGSEAISYPLPPASACMGMIQSIMRNKNVTTELVAVATCRQPRWLGYAYNSHSAFKTKSDASTLQIRESVLEAPCFQILALLCNNDGKTQPVNHAHSTQEQFYRRLRLGQSFYPVALGRKEFLASYWGYRLSQIETGYCCVVPSMVMRTLLDSHICRDVRQNVIIRNGILKFSDVDVTLKNGKLAFAEDYYQWQVEHYEGDTNAE